MLQYERNCWLSRDQLRGGDKIKNDAFSRKFHFSRRSLGSPAQVAVRFEGSQARQNGYLVFRRSNPELFPLSSARRARMPTIFRSLEPLFTAFVLETSKYWRSLLKRRVRSDYIVANTALSVKNQKGYKE